MQITTDEIRSLDLPRAWLRGYRRSSVDELFEDIVDSFERVVRERVQVADRVQELQAEASKHRELETLLRSTLISAERASQEMKEQARRESDLIVLEAHAESRRIIRECAAEKRRLEEDVRKIRAQLVAAFEMLGEWPGARSTKSEEAAAAPATGPSAIGDALDSGIRSLTRQDAPIEARS